MLRLAARRAMRDATGDVPVRRGLSAPPRTGPGRPPGPACGTHSGLAPPESARSLNSLASHVNPLGPRSRNPGGSAADREVRSLRRFRLWHHLPPSGRHPDCGPEGSAQTSKVAGVFHGVFHGVGIGFKENMFVAVRQVPPTGCKAGRSGVSLLYSIRCRWSRRPAARGASGSPPALSIRFAALPSIEVVQPLVDHLFAAIEDYQ